MARLTIASTEYPVQLSGVRYDDLTKRRQAWSGAMTTAWPTGVGALRVWSFQTDIITRAESTTLLAALSAQGTVSANGEAVGGSAVTCRAANISAQEIFEDMVLVSFELWEES